MIHSCLPLRTAVRSLQYEEGDKINEVANDYNEFIMKWINKRLRQRMTLPGVFTLIKMSKKSFSVDDEINTPGSGNGTMEALS